MTFTTEYISEKWMSRTNEKELSVILKPVDDSGEELVPVTSDDNQEPTNDDNSNITNNPQTGDNILFYISMLGLCIIGLVGTELYIRKRNQFN